MKKIIIMLMLACTASLVFAQVKGNGELTTKRFALGEVQEMLININANIDIDAAATENYIEITTDENLVEYLIPENDNGTIELTQSEWVKPKKGLNYKLGLTNLLVLKNDSWADVTITNMNQEKFRYQSLVGGEAHFKGKVNELTIAAEAGQINAAELIAQNAFINIWDDATVTVNVVNTINSDVSNDGQLIYVSEPNNLKKKTSANGKVYSQEEHAQLPEPEEVKFITFKIKSKGTETIQAYVKGPNGRGGNFSYGLPIRPFTPRKETWSIGTKLYSVNKLGVKKLIYTVKAEDEGKVVIVSKK